MKKIISLILLLLSVGIFLGYSFYTKQWPFDYRIAQFIEYILYWGVTLFVTSIFALMLNNRKYKIWLLISLIFSLLTVLFAHETGNGNGAIVNINGELITWFSVGLYSFVSITYFIVQYFKNRKQSTLVK